MVECSSNPSTWEAEAKDQSSLTTPKNKFPPLQEKGLILMNDGSEKDSISPR